MARIQLFELEDFAWYPARLRNLETDLLRAFIRWFSPYRHATPVLERCLERAESAHVLDLCSGGGGPWPELSRAMDVRVTLSDLFPNRPAFERERAVGDGRIDFHATPIDATHVPASAGGGMRTLFSALHHFPPEVAREILADAQRAAEPIAIFEGTHRSLLAVLFFLFTPLAVLVMTPFLRPFSWYRLLFTYVVPIVPLVAWWDAIVSCLRTYSTQELRALAAQVEQDGWTWEVGQCPGAPLVPMTYLAGYPDRP